MIMKTNDSSLRKGFVDIDLLNSSGVLPISQRALFIALLLLLSASFGLSAAPEACNDPDEKTNIVCEAKAFAAADHRLNERYPQIRARLGVSLQKALLDQQKRWIGYRDYMCSMDPSRETSADQVRCMTELTLARIDYLQRAWSAKVPTGNAGIYDDGFGGTLKIAEEKGKWNFKFEVVRGPTVHTGEYEGVIPMLKGEYSFSEGEGDEKCQLKFKKRERSIEVTEISCAGYHGARADFSGVYYRMP